MKISELKQVQREAEEPLPYPRSELAVPPISRAEALGAETAICCWHNGRIKTDPTSSDVEGRVYLCPIGGKYWRYSKGGSESLKLPPLKYSWNLK